MKPAAAPVVDRLSGSPLLVDRWAEWSGAIDCGETGRHWPADAVHALTDEIEARLTEIGAAPGEPVLLALGNTVAFPAVLVALLRRRCNPMLAHAAIPLAAVQRRAAEFGIRHIIHDFIDGLGALGEDDLRASGSIAVGKMTIMVLESGFRGEGRIAVPGEGVVLMPTSGTSGAAKYCVRNQEALVHEGEMVARRVDLFDRARVTLTTPLTHAFALGFGMATAILTDSTIALDPLFNPKRLLRREAEATSDVLAIVPPMAKALLDLADAEPALAPAVFYAGAPVDPAIAASFEDRFGTTLYTIYGTTESGVLTTTYDDGRRLEGVGRAFDGVTVRTSHDDRHRQLGTDVGEVEVTSPGLMHGYLPGATGESTPVASFVTGDLGVIDDAGNLRLVGRMRDIINLGGLKVDPTEVEAVLMAHPAVADAAVYLGRRGKGADFVQAAVVADADPADLRAYCAGELEAFKVPTVIHLVEVLPRTPSGKCLKIKCPGHPAQLASEPVDA